ncbi:PIN-like domain-containing protein, partial [Escherichia coli]
MKSTFLGFYSTPTESLADIWLDDSTLFVFDTNCLLNLYRCEDHTREDIIKVMKAVAPRTWIPFQVGFEFQRNRRVVIEDSIA